PPGKNVHAAKYRNRRHRKTVASRDMLPMCRAMADPSVLLDDLPHADRIRSRKLANGVATVIADATGLSQSARDALEHDLNDAALALPGVTEARIAVTAAQPNRILIAVGSGKGGVGKSTVAT